MPSEEPIFTEYQWELLEARLVLPPRQREVIRHLFDGMSDKQIAGALGISLSTVRSHLGRIYARFGLQDRTELVLHVIREFIAMDGIFDNDIIHDDN